MELLPALGVVLGGIGALLAVFATLRGQSAQTQEAQLTLAWDMQEKQLDMLVADKNDCQERLRAAEARLVEQGNKIFEQERQLHECREARRQLEIQVELLKLKIGGHGG